MATVAAPEPVCSLNPKVEATGESTKEKTMKSAKTKSKKPSAKPSIRRKEPLDCPLFLRKTYHMVDTCDPTIAGWTEDGDMFVVKDPEVFASTIIPQFFKHSNFASFVRQLNFYGFRKVKCDPIKLDTPVDEAESKYWRFRHKNFQKDRLDLLNEMRRKDPNASPPEQGEDVTVLKTEVRSLKSRMDNMSKDIDKLTSMMENMMKEKEEEKEMREDASIAMMRDACPDVVDLPSVEDMEGIKREIAGIKKRKVSNLLPNLATASDADFLVEDVLSSSSDQDPSEVQNVSIEPANPSGRLESFTSITSVERDFVNELFNDIGMSENDDESKVLPHFESLDSSVSSNIGFDVDPALMRKLHDALALLPKKVQELFVERLVLAITNPEAYKSNIDTAVTLSAASSAVQESKSSAPKTKEASVSLPLAAATLSAILAQCGSAPKGLPIVPVHA